MAPYGMHKLDCGKHYEKPTELKLDKDALLKCSSIAKVVSAILDSARSQGSSANKLCDIVSYYSSGSAAGFSDEDIIEPSNLCDWKLGKNKPTYEKAKVLEDALKVPDVLTRFYDKDHKPIKAAQKPSPEYALK